MEIYKKIIPLIQCRDGKFLIGGEDGVYSQDVKELGRFFGNCGADELLIEDSSKTEAEHDRHIGLIKELGRVLDIPFILGGNINRFEDVKKYLYTGAKAVYLDSLKDTNVDLLKEAADRFGSERIYMNVQEDFELRRLEEYQILGASQFMIKEALLEKKEEILKGSSYSVIVTAGDGSQKTLEKYLSLDFAAGTAFTEFTFSDSWMETKYILKENKINVDTFETSIGWNEFKLNEAQMVPVIVQDYKTDEVLMLAYMNEEAFDATMRTGKMNYYSRSRQSLWLKGETSGHFQYVKSLAIDCDKDTMLAKVAQIGPACHTGSNSCFFNELAAKNTVKTNPLKVFEEVYQVILDRKEHPKEGSYTNYLFDKGIDKILKKVGEEATEIIIAAKNPDPEEIKYEISDFLYHMMVLMAEKGVSWEDIMQELADR